MAKKSRTKRNGQNIKTNMAKRLARAKAQGKSEAYIKDLETALSKRK